MCAAAVRLLPRWLRLLRPRLGVEAGAGREARVLAHPVAPEARQLARMPARLVAAAVDEAAAVAAAPVAGRRHHRGESAKCLSELAWTICRNWPLS
jgi:hypothetical protein